MTTNPVTVHTERGDLRGTLLGIDPRLQLAQVCIPTKDAPAWFREAHPSPAPNVWVSVKDVEHNPG